MPATAVWIPLTQTPSRPFRAWTVKERRDPTSLPFDSRETETQRGVTCQRWHRGEPRNPRLQTPVPGSPPLPLPSPFQHPSTAPRLGATPSGPLWGQTEATGRRRGLLASRPPPAHLPLSGQPGEPRLRGLS